MKQFFTWFTGGVGMGALCVCYVAIGYVWGFNHQDGPCRQSDVLANWKPNPTKPAGRFKYQCVWYDSPKGEPPYCVWEEE